jgi:hypothetical protein
MQGTGKFPHDLQVGKAYEDEVIEIFELLFDAKMRKVTKEKDLGLYLHLDIIEDYRGRKREFPELISAECKFTSEKHDDSPNVIVEYQTYGDEPSGIATSLAMYWVFKTGKFHLIVRRDELLRTILFDMDHAPSHRRIKVRRFDKKTIMLVPIELLLDAALCPSTQRQLTKQAMANSANGDDVT